ncbi:MAG: hypothetical protein WAP03_21755 [Methylorubrum rhodinum]|uniref:hypothetical protein n=1 Tax=Methylorubrum rhodinum TaxID=29428 RepID=UPI003BAE9E4D
MNAPLRSDAVAIPLRPATTVFRVRPRTALMFDVVVEMVGRHVFATDEKLLVVASGLYGEEAANAAALALAETFRAEHPGRPVDTKLAPILGKRPGQVYGLFGRTRDRDDEHRLGPRDTLHGARGW